MTTQLRIEQLGKTTPVLITPPGTHSGVDITIQNNGTNYDVLVGDQNVGQSQYGHKIAAGKAVAFTVAPNDSLYIISTGEFADVSILTLGLVKK